MCTLEKSCIELSFLTCYMALIPRAGSSPGPVPSGSSSWIIPVAVVVGIVLMLLALGIVVFLVLLFCCRAGCTCMYHALIITAF